MKLGIIARADKTGLGNQTRNLVRLLNPYKIMVIDSSYFNGNTQYFANYQGRNAFATQGFPKTRDIFRFLAGIDAVLTCELFYNHSMPDMMNMRGIRSYNQYNYEFLDHLANPKLTLPTKLLSPSKWMLEEMEAAYPGRVEYLPPPTFAEDYASVREVNMNREGKPRFLHVVGRMAVNDRNGTFDLLEALKYTRSNLEIVLKVQSASPELLSYVDDRVTIDTSAPLDETDLYKDFDALILPRRYAGLCLPMNEGLISGLPVIMTDISPNNKVLPEEWLVQSELKGEFNTRTLIPFYSANPQALAAKIDWLCNTDLRKEKEKAYKLGYENYSAEALRPRYEEIII